MRITVDASARWQRRGSALVCGEIVVHEMSDRWSTAPGASFVTRAGWMLERHETCDTTVAVLAATLVIDHEAATLVARCPVEVLDEARAAFDELLRGARPVWPESLLISDLLALPEVES